MIKWTTLLLFVNLALYGQDQLDFPETQRVLKAWVQTQNEGTDEAISAFIDTFYSPDMLKRMKNRDAHMKFYRQVIDEFGEIQSIIYEKETDTAHSLKVQLLKKATPLVPEPGPEEILVVEIDLDPEDPKYLRRGLGAGALICYIKR